MKQQEKIEEELQGCTFQPSINKVNKTHHPFSKDKSIEGRVKGYFKTIGRLREANEKHLENKKIKEHVPCGENYEKLKKKAPNPPQFLNRKKPQSSPILLSLQLEICHKKITLTVREGDQPCAMVAELCQIYHFGPEVEEEILEILEEQLSGLSGDLG